MEGDVGGGRGATHQRIRDVVVIFNVQLNHVERGTGIIQIEPRGLVGDWDGPEQAIGSDSGVEVVNLIGRGELPLVQVQSDEGEGACVAFAVYANVDALHDACIHVRD
jgi:hypothetical protein